MFSYRQEYLERTLQLARLGGTSVVPNPRVGAVIVHQDRIIGEGYHAFAGGPHAEVNAVKAVNDPSLLADSTIYVSLEPCNHFGKTPPCVDLIIRHKIPRVVVGCLDPNPLVAGQGIERLRNNNVDVIIAEHIEPFIEINKAFFVNQLYKRPYITLKWAESRNGVIGGLTPDHQPYPIPITGPEANTFTHNLRAEHQSIMVGANTAIADNPSLTTRNYPGDHPLRIVFDMKGRLPSSLKIFSDGFPTMIIGPERQEKAQANVSFFQPGQVRNLQELLKDLYKEKGICSILIEGGRHLLQQFIDQEMFDEIFLLRSDKMAQDGVLSPVLPQKFIFEMAKSIGRDQVYTFKRTSF